MFKHGDRVKYNGVDGTVYDWRQIDFTEEQKEDLPSFREELETGISVFILRDDGYYGAWEPYFLVYCSSLQTIASAPGRQTNNPTLLDYCTRSNPNLKKDGFGTLTWIFCMNCKKERK